MPTLASVIDTVFTLTNDWNRTLWTKEILAAFLQEAHRELQVELQLNGIPVINVVSSILHNFPQGATVLSLTSTPALPSDLIVPEKLWERDATSTDEFDEMVEKSWEPELQQVSTLNYWVWRKEAIYFIGATSARDLKLQYKAGIALPVNDVDTMGFIQAELYLAPRAASLALNSLGDDKGAANLDAIAQKRLSQVIRMNVKNQQALPVRRRPYRRVRNYIIGR